MAQNQKTFSDIVKLLTDPNRASAIESDPALKEALNDQRIQASTRLHMADAYRIAQQLRTGGRSDAYIDAQMKQVKLPFSARQLDAFVHGLE